VIAKKWQTHPFYLRAGGMSEIILKQRPETFSTKQLRNVRSDPIDIRDLLDKSNFLLFSLWGEGNP